MNGKNAMKMELTQNNLQAPIDQHPGLHLDVFEYNRKPVAAFVYIQPYIHVCSFDSTTFA